MRVKVGNTWYHCHDEPVAVELSPEDKRNIAKMGKQKKYCAFPTRMDEEEVRKWLVVENP